MKNNVRTHSVTVGDKELSFETGRLAHQADGAVVVRWGDVIIFSSVEMSASPRQNIDFFPLLVDFEGKFYAAGRLKGSRFMKREARPPESAILYARMTDRCLRPLFPKGMTNDVQVVQTLLQTDELHNPSAAAICASSMAIQISGIPFGAPVGAVRVGMREDGSYYADPTFEESDNGKLDLLVAGTEDAITMVESGSDLISNDEILGALEFAHGEIKRICQAQAEFAKEHEIEEKTPIFREEPSDVAKEAVDSFIKEDDLTAVEGVTKKDVKKQLTALKEGLLEHYAAQIEAEELSAGDLKHFFEKRFGENMRNRVFATGKRLDGRATDEIRPLNIEVGLFPRLHGSALFQRGETQALSIATVAGPGAAEIIDDPDRPERKRYYLHHYNFPPYCVGEVRPMRSTSRREIGHGILAERALLPVVPKQEEGFPYVLRVVSEIMTCNGSSSMASVCGSTLCLMDAGIPLKTPIAGIAMGLLMQEDGEYKILTDIQGAEDFGGDMDFKVTGDEEGITALQMDIKIKGLQISLLKEALEQAQVARQHILKEMKAVMPESRKELSDFAPQIHSVQINPDLIKVVIGKGGETIQGMCKDFGVEIDIEDSGLIMVTAPAGSDWKGALEKINALTYEPKAGDMFEATVKSIMDFGAFVEYLPGKEALVHISAISEERVDKVSDFLEEGQKINVKATGFDKMGRLQLTMVGVDQPN